MFPWGFRKKRGCCIGIDELRPKILHNFTLENLRRFDGEIRRIQPEPFRIFGPIFPSSLFSQMNFIRRWIIRIDCKVAWIKAFALRTRAESGKNKGNKNETSEA